MKLSNVIVLLGIACLDLTCRTHSASGASLFELRRASIEVGGYFQRSHNAYLLLDRDREWLDKETSMIMNIDLTCNRDNSLCLFWNNRVEGKASNRQYRQIGWLFSFGVSISDKLEIGWSHVSEHELDRKSNPDLPYPVENVIYVEMKFVDRPRIVQ